MRGGREVAGGEGAEQSGSAGGSRRSLREARKRDLIHLLSVRRDGTGLPRELMPLAQAVERTTVAVGGLQCTLAAGNGHRGRLGRSAGNLCLLVEAAEEERRRPEGADSCARGCRHNARRREFGAGGQDRVFGAPCSVGRILRGREGGRRVALLALAEFEHALEREAEHVSRTARPPSRHGWAPPRATGRAPHAVRRADAASICTLR